MSVLHYSKMNPRGRWYSTYSEFGERTIRSLDLEAHWSNRTARVRGRLYTYPNVLRGGTGLAVDVVVANFCSIIDPRSVDIVDRGEKSSGIADILQLGNGRRFSIFS